MKAISVAEYPILTQDGRYISTILVTLTNDHNLVNKAANNQLSSMNQSILSVQSKQNKP